MEETLSYCVIEPLLCNNILSSGFRNQSVCQKHMTASIDASFM